MIESLIRRPQDVIFGWVAIVSLVALGLFSLNAFFPLAALLGGTLLWVLIWLLVFGRALPGAGLARSDLKFLLLVITLGLTFRAGPYQCVVGGQDQGVYVNMSYSYDREHGAFHVDPVRSQLKDSGLIEAYDAANMVRKSTTDSGTGTFLPGVYIEDLEDSEYVFQFYHLHPLWMSMFGSVLGGLSRLYSLTFFSILSLVAFYLLVLELFGNRTLALVAGLLLALNPLHAFFSKFPVSEVVALAFTTSSFYYLVRFHKRARDGAYDRDDLFLSALLLGCMFFTRISGFMYLPTIWLILAVVLVAERRRRIRRGLITYCFAVGGLYAVSVVYGLQYSTPYALDIYNLISFGRILGPDWPIRLFALVSLIAILTLVVWILVRNEGWRQRFGVLLQRGNTVLPWFFILVGILGLWKVYRLAWGGGDFSNWMIAHWDLAGKGMESVLRSSLVVAGSYVSPPLAIFALSGVFSRKGDPHFRLLLLFLLQFVVHISFILWLVPYQYYYARYLVSEAVPFSIVVAMAGLITWWAKPRGRRIAVVLVLAAAGYFLYFTAHQWLGKEAEGAYVSLEELTRDVDRDDLIFMRRDAFEQQTQIRTPLIYLFNRRVVVFEKADVLQRYEEMRRGTGWPFKDHFVLTSREIASPMLEPAAQAAYREGHFERTVIIPRRFSYDYEFPLFLYKIGDRELGEEAVELLEQTEF